MRHFYVDFDMPPNYGEEQDPYGDAWSNINPTSLWDDDAPRRQPSVVADDQGGLWLFWKEKVDGQWRLKYNRHDGTGWERDDAAEFSIDVGTDLFARLMGIRQGVQSLPAGGFEGAGLLKLLPRVQ